MANPFRTAAFVVATMLLACSPAGAQNSLPPPPLALSNPQPTIDHPRKIVLSLSERDPLRVTEVIGNVGNIQRFYGADEVQLALVVYGPGVHALLRDESQVADRIAGLIAIGVEVEACQATLTTLNKDAKDLLPGVRVIPNGIPEIVERQVAGWIYVRP
jgi:intracellular sulfur oxidation DsrE/DsrF family protein